MRGAWRQTQIVDLHKQGLGVSEIAEAIGWQDSDVTRALRAARNRGDLPDIKPPSVDGAEWRAKALADWETGRYRVIDISRRVGISQGAVSRFLRQACGEKSTARAAIAPGADQARRDRADARDPGRQGGLQARTRRWRGNRADQHDHAERRNCQKPFGGRGMTEICVLSTAGLAPPRVIPDAGAPPELQWIDIDALYVDMSYQRELGKHNRTNIGRIAAGFDWAYFAPVVVSPMDGAAAFFCIIDGQHRTLAAKLIGKTKVPCSVVSADRAKQASAFGAINGVVTHVHPQQLHRSAVAAKNPGAVAIESAVTEGKARILASPTSAKNMKPGDTNSVVALRKCLERYGRERLVRALLVINEAPRPYRCMITGPFLDALCQLMEERWSRVATQARFASINLGVVEEEARKAHAGKGPLSPHIVAAIRKRLG